MAKDSGFRFTTVTAEVLDARERVIHEHGRLRGHLFALQAIARDVALDGSREDELRDGVRRLCVEMIRHLETEEQLLSHNRLGSSWEGFALEEVAKALRVDSLYYWRTHTGAELDLTWQAHGKR